MEIANVSVLYMGIFKEVPVAGYRVISSPAKCFAAVFVDVVDESCIKACAF